MKNFKCPKCGETINRLVKHHISYIPEIIEYVCDKCNKKERRSVKCRGPKIVMTYPQTGFAFLGKELANQFNSAILEIEMAPVSPIGIVFPYGMNFNEVLQCLNIISSNLELRVENELRIASKEPK